MVDIHTINIGDRIIPVAGEEQEVMSLQKIKVRDGFIYSINGFIPEHILKHIKKP